MLLCTCGMLNTLPTDTPKALLFRVQWESFDFRYVTYITHIEKDANQLTSHT